jgi:hypothetical protein
MIEYIELNKRLTCVFMRITETVLRSIIKSEISRYYYLNEDRRSRKRRQKREARKKLSAEIDPRIAKQIKIMKDYNLTMYLTDTRDTLTVKIRGDESLDKNWEYKQKYDVPRNKEIGSVTFVKYGYQSNSRGKKDRRSIDRKNPSGIKVGGKIRKNAWYCISSSVKEIGLGPIMYEVGIEYISKFKNCAVMPDVWVSNEAAAVWKKFDERPDIEKYQFDIDTDLSIDMYNNYNRNLAPHNGSTLPDEIQSGSLKQITPDDNSDDIVFDLIYLQNSGNYSEDDFAKGKWADSPLTRGYFNDRGRVIKSLYSQNLIRLEHYHQIFRPKE